MLTNPWVILQGTFGKVKEWIALVILVLVLFGLAFDIAHRTWVSFTGSFAMLGECRCPYNRHSSPCTPCCSHPLLLLT